MKAKGAFHDKVVVLDRTATVATACLRMLDTKQSAVVIVEGSTSVPIGIFTERDVLRKVVYKRRSAALSLSDVMTAEPKTVPSSCDNLLAMETMSKGRFRHLPVVSPESGSLVGLFDSLILGKALMQRGSKGLLTRTRLFVKSFFSKWSSSDAGLDMSLSSVCAGGGILAVNPTGTVQDAVELMASMESSAVLVRDPSGTGISGIFTERDLVARVVAVGKDPTATNVGDVMTHNPDCVDSSASVEEALKRMTENHYRHLPIIDDSGFVCGMMDVAQLLQTVTGSVSASRQTPKLPAAATAAAAAAAASAATAAAASSSSTTGPSTPVKPSSSAESDVESIVDTPAGVLSPPLALLSPVAAGAGAGRGRGGPSSKPRTSSASTPARMLVLSEGVARTMEQAVIRARQGRNQMMQMNFHGAGTRFSFALRKLKEVQPKLADRLAADPSQEAFDAMATLHALATQVLAQRADAVGFDGRPEDAVGDLREALRNFDKQMAVMKQAKDAGKALQPTGRPTAAAPGTGVPAMQFGPDIQAKLLSELAIAHIQCCQFEDVVGVLKQMDDVGTGSPSWVSARSSVFQHLHTEIQNIAETAEELLESKESYEALRSYGVLLKALVPFRSLAASMERDTPSAVPPPACDEPTALACQVDAMAAMDNTSGAVQVARQCVAAYPTAVVGYVKLAELLVETRNVLQALMTACTGMGVATAESAGRGHSVEEHEFHAALNRVVVLCQDAVQVRQTGGKENATPPGADVKTVGVTTTATSATVAKTKTTTATPPPAPKVAVRQELADLAALLGGQA